MPLLSVPPASSRATARLAVAALLLVALLAPRALPQDAGAPPADPPGSAAPDQQAPPATPAEASQPPFTLQPGEVARIDDTLSLTDADLDRYLATVYARMPEGDAVLNQLVAEAAIEHDGEALGFVVTDADIDAAQASLDEQARAAGGEGLAASLGKNVSPATLRHALKLLVLHERLVRSTQNLPADAPVDPQQLKLWLDGRMSTANVQPAPLDDPLAATFDAGTITKAQVGARLRTVLDPKDVSGVLTEMLGVLLVRRKANELAIDLTPAAATQEVIDRDQALRARAGVGDVTYRQYLETVQKRTLEELLRSDKFSTEVLIRLIVQRDWTEETAKAFWEKNRESFAKTVGDDATWETARAAVWRELRQRAYRHLFEESTIVRRF